MKDGTHILRFLGLAQRAGKLVSGFDQVAETIRKGEGKLLILSEDISENTLKKILDTVGRSSAGEIPAYSFGTSEDLGYYTGNKPRAVLAVTDKGFADRLDEMLSNYDKTEDQE